ncbi:MAG TPA: hypothetical protein VMD59_11735 [Acidimicrobiales bacterium]|nr:hypothetical protein [Acidimicrobiales bacterium]
MNTAQGNFIEDEGVLHLPDRRRRRRLVVSGGAAGALGIVAALAASSLAAGGVAPRVNGVVSSVNGPAHSFTVESSSNKTVVKVDRSTQYLSGSACYMGLVAVKVGEHVSVTGAASDSTEIASVVEIGAASPNAPRSGQS